jgi:hypothetical protein
MRNGLYKVSFSSAGNAGNGVVALVDGKVRGGDSSFAYVGSLNHQGGGATGQINVFRHSDGLPSVFGIESFQLNLDAKATDTELHGTAETPAAAGATLVIDMVFITEI